ncbi:MAG: permease [Candidatus Hodarchaeales archaeon]|jgi:uncharacterized membrane protein YraQ (UPF0718 family)
MSENQFDFEMELTKVQEKAKKEQDQAPRVLSLIESLFMNFLLFIIVLVVLIFCLINIPEKIPLSIEIIIQETIDIVPVFIIACLAAGWVDVWVDKAIVVKHLDDDRLILSLTKISILGIIVPGPIFTILPLALVLYKKGAKPYHITAFFTAQTLIGPMRIPFELHYFGLNFFVVRTILAFVMGIFAGLMTYPFSTYIDKEIQGLMENGGNNNK